MFHSFQAVQTSELLAVVLCLWKAGIPHGCCSHWPLHWLIVHTWHGSGRQKLLSSCQSNWLLSNLSFKAMPCLLWISLDMKNHVRMCFLRKENCHIHFYKNCENPFKHLLLLLCTKESLKKRKKKSRCIRDSDMSLG